MSDTYDVVIIGGGPGGFPQAQEAEEIIEKGVDINAKGLFGDTPLHIAAQFGHTEIAELLIAKGADVNADNAKETPLHRAATNGHYAIAELLIAAGVDVNAKNVGGVRL
ncbi:ankyrin repeat domain-containing protein, partial [Henriciella sp.]|uniref:ankyrin repeat domain-containing protein n=1 Tax=Henriciella sp. TaxID=1968823 RepID=UPI00178DE6B2